MSGNLCALLAARLGAAHADRVLEMLEVDPAVRDETTARVSRAVVAMALNALLFDDLLSRVPTGSAYVAERRAQGARVRFDHGALRTIDFGAAPCGAIPGGVHSVARLLEPLGYTLAGVYPLDRLRMTGRAFVHADFPESLPQFFVSELHVGRFSAEFQAAAHRVFDSTREPLGTAARQLLEQLGDTRSADPATAAAGLAELTGAFGRWHDTPALADYRTLLRESAEAAWIATEGSAFNHATDRVPDVHATAEAQRALGRPIKDHIEISAAGSVRQTAFKADPVKRHFRADDGSEIVESVPGSFYEFITRDTIRDERGTLRLDLRFDSSNAQGIFKMTSALG